MTGILTVLLALVAGVGFACLVGVPVNPISVQVLPFVVLSVGLDNVYVLVFTFSSTDAAAPVGDRLASTFRSSGVAILLATIICVASFLFGLVIDLSVIVSLCQLVAIVLSVNCVLQFSFFAAAMVIDDERQRSGRADLCCWVRPQRHGEEKRESLAKAFFADAVLPALANPVFASAVVRARPLRAPPAMTDTLTAGCRFCGRGRRCDLWLHAANRKL